MRRLPPTKSSRARKYNRQLHVVMDRLTRAPEQGLLKACLSDGYTRETLITTFARHEDGHAGSWEGARVQIVTWSALHIEAGIIVLFVIDLFSSGCLSSLAEKKMDKMQSVEY